MCVLRGRGYDNASVSQLVHNKHIRKCTQRYSGDVKVMDALKLETGNWDKKSGV